MLKTLLVPEFSVNFDEGNTIFAFLWYLCPSCKSG